MFLLRAPHSVVHRWVSNDNKAFKKFLEIDAFKKNLLADEEKRVTEWFLPQSFSTTIESILGFSKCGLHKSSTWFVSWSPVRFKLLSLAWLNNLLIVIDWTPGVNSHMSRLISITILDLLSSIEKHAGKCPVGHPNMADLRSISRSRRWSQVVPGPGHRSRELRSSRHCGMSEWGHWARATVTECT